MKLVPLSTEQALSVSSLWLPFLQRVAGKRKVSPDFLLREVVDGVTQVCLLWADDIAQGALGIRISLQAGERVGELHWIAGQGRAEILSLMPGIEAFLKSHHGCVAVDVTGRNSLARVLKGHGYSQTQVTVSKRL